MLSECRQSRLSEAASDHAVARLNRRAALARHRNADGAAHQRQAADADAHADADLRLLAQALGQRRQRADGGDVDARDVPLSQESGVKDSRRVVEGRGGLVDLGGAPAGRGLEDDVSDDGPLGEVGDLTGVGCGDGGVGDSSPRALRQPSFPPPS
jgi:hypothetical protein